MLAVEINLF